MRIRSTESGIIAWFVRNPVAANLAMLFLIVAGVLTALHIKKEIYPENRSGVVSIQIAYPGASPSDVEEGIAKKVEESLRGMAGIKEIRAECGEGMADIRLTAKSGAAVPEFLNEIRSRVAGIDTFPDEAERPRITEEVLKTEVMWLILHGPLGDRSLKRLSEEIRDELSARASVSQVTVVGTNPSEISINLSEASLRRFGIGFDQVAEAVAGRSLDLPGGQIRTPSERVALRALGRSRTRAGFEDIVVDTRPDGTIVRVRDVAQVTDGFPENEGFLHYNGDPAVGLQIFRTAEENTLTLADRVRRYVAEKGRELPPGTRLDIVADMSVQLKDRLSLMVRNMMTGGLLVFVCLALFLRLDVAFWVMAGIPVSFLGALWLMPLPFIGLSLNMVTLYGFILVLGIVVDDAIVIGESIDNTVRHRGPGIPSVVAGARAVSVPATFGVLTTVAAFVPLITIPGANGRMWAGIGWVVILTLTFSLIESKLILPAHLRRIGTAPERAGQPAWLGLCRTWAGNGLTFLIERGYRPLLSLNLQYRYGAIAAFVGIFILAMAGVKAGVVRVVLFPDIDSDIVVAELEMAESVSPERLRAAIVKVEAAAEAVNANFMARGETGPPLCRRLSYTASETRGGFYVELSPSGERKATTAAILAEWRKLTRDVRTMPGVRSLKFSSAMAEAAGAPLDFELSGSKTAALTGMAREIRQALASYRGVSDVRDTGEALRPEIRISSRAEGMALGISLAAVAGQVRSAFYGKKVVTFQRGSESVDVFVRYPQTERRSVAGLESMWIRGGGDLRVPLEAVARLESGSGPARILRKDFRRVVSVRASVDKAQGSPDRIVAEVLGSLVPKLAERYRGVAVRAAGESEEAEASLISMAKWGGLSLFAIFALMAVPLSSYTRPAIIMTAIPFGIVGAVLGHLLLGLPVSILSLCGIIALSGVVVNDALVLVDCIHQRRKGPGSVARAVDEACCQRFRAVVLTSLTTFLGLLPMVTEKGLQAQFLIPMAVSLAFGILFSTLITLFLIPALYLVMEDMVGLVRQFTRKCSRKTVRR